MGEQIICNIVSARRGDGTPIEMVSMLDCDALVDEIVEDRREGRFGPRSAPNPESVRAIMGHHVASDKCRHGVQSLVIDQPDESGACHAYEAMYVQNPDSPADTYWVMASLDFQKGPIAEVGVNGINNEVLLAIVLDRLLGFQSGPLACHANAEAYRHLEAALVALKGRTEDRVSRNAEDKNEA